MRVIYNILAALFILVGVSGCSAMYDDAMPSYEKTALVRVGDTAPDFTIQTLDGQSITLSQQRGKTVLLVFFATYCPDCKKQLSVLEGVKERFADKEFTILTISRGEKEEDVRAYFDERDYTFAVAVDGDSSIYNLYATRYVPRCYVIDPLGRIVALSAEYDEDEFELLCDVIEMTVGD